MKCFRLLLEIGSSNGKKWRNATMEECFRLLLEIGSSNFQYEVGKTYEVDVSVSCWRLVLLTTKKIIMLFGVTFPSPVGDWFF